MPRKESFKKGRGLPWRSLPVQGALFWSLVGELDPLVATKTWLSQVNKLVKRREGSILSHAVEKWDRWQTNRRNEIGGRTRGYRFVYVFIIVSWLISLISNWEDLHTVKSQLGRWQQRWEWHTGQKWLITSTAPLLSTWSLSWIPSRRTLGCLLPAVRKVSMADQFLTQSSLRFSWSCLTSHSYASYTRIFWTFAWMAPIAENARFPLQPVNS